MISNGDVSNAADVNAAANGASTVGGDADSSSQAHTRSGRVKVPTDKAKGAMCAVRAWCSLRRFVEPHSVAARVCTR